MVLLSQRLTVASMRLIGQRASVELFNQHWLSEGLNSLVPCPTATVYTFQDTVGEIEYFYTAVTG